jgi:large repetitive protein
MFKPFRSCLCTALALVAFVFANSGCAPLLFFLQVAFLLPQPPSEPPPNPPAGQPILPPEVVDVSVTTPEDTAVSLSVLTGDSAIDAVAATLVFTIDPDASHGVVAIDPATKMIQYTPAANYHGPDTFTLSVCDANLPPNCATATVNVTVTPVNDAPLAGNDSHNTDEDIGLDVAAAGVLINDTDAEGDPLTAILVTGPTQGTLVFNADGSFSYTAGNNNTLPAGQSFMDSFTYKANDGTSDSNIATVTIEVIGVHNLPIAVDDSFTMTEDIPLIVPAPGVLANDLDPDIGDSITASLEVGPANGNASLNPDGSFTYTPQANFNGMDFFTYRATDSVGFFSIATVTITITPINDPPVAGNDSLTTNEDTPLDVPTSALLANDFDVDGDTITFFFITFESSLPGTVAFDEDSVTFTPVADYNGPASFTYTVRDPGDLWSTATVHITVNPVNDPPVANNDSLTTDEDTPLIIPISSLLANDFDVDGDPVTFISHTPAEFTHGSASFLIDHIRYTPLPDYNGPASFTYTISDGHGGTDTATINITINSVNDPPVAVNDSFTTDEDTPLVIPFANLLANDFDEEGDPLAPEFQGPDGSFPGTLFFDTMNNSVTFTPNPDYNGPASFGYRVQDTHGALSNTATVNITVNAVNDAPVDGGE